MTDYTGLKRLCAALISANEAYLEDSCSSENQERFHAADDALQDALPPEVVLAIIAENEILRESPGMRVIRSLRGDCADLMAECDQLKTENEALRQNAERYQWLRDKQTFIWLIQDWFPSDAEFTDVDAEIDAAMNKGWSVGCRSERGSTAPEFPAQQGSACGSENQ